MALCGARSVDYVVEVVARELSLKIVGVVKIKLDEVYPAVCEILPRAALAYRRPCLEAPPEGLLDDKAAYETACSGH